VPVSVPVLIIALAVTAFGAAVQGTIGFGFGVISVPLLSLVDPVLVPVPQLLAVIPLTLATFWRERGDVDLSGTGWIIAGRFPGALLGLGLLSLASGAAGERLLDVMIACSVLVAVAVQASPVRIRPTRTSKFFAGIASGITGLVASIGGPPIGLLYRGEAGATVRSTLAAVFTIGLTITVAARIAADRITGDDVRIALAILPAMLVGFLGSYRLRGLIEGRRLRVGILVVSTLASAGLLLRAVA
jgi:uncharacterized membrane protein YfcA